MSSDKKNNRKKIIVWTAVFVWIAAILFFASQPHYSSLDWSVLHKLFEKINPEFNGLSPEQQKYDVWVVQIGIRKLGHFVAFMGLGLLLLTALYEYSMKRALRIAAVLTFCIMLAGAEEIRQIFQAGRSPLVIDVVIDAGGALIGMWAAALLHRRRSASQKEKTKDAVI